jgi:hypothetical protein
MTTEFDTKTASRAARLVIRASEHASEQVTMMRESLAQVWAKGFKVDGNRIADYGNIEARYNTLARAAALLKQGAPEDELDEIALNGAMSTASTWSGFGEGYDRAERRAWGEVHELLHSI